MSARWGATALVLATLMATGCAPRPASAPEPARPDVPTLMVDNRSGYQVGVYLDGTRIGTATTGESCIRIPQSQGELRLVFAPTGLPPVLGPIAYLQESRHWQVELKPGVTMKYDVLGLAPAAESCTA